MLGALRLPLCDTCQLQISSVSNTKRISHQERLMLQAIDGKTSMRSIVCLLVECPGLDRDAV